MELARINSLPEFLEERTCVDPRVGVIIPVDPATEAEQVVIGHLRRANFFSRFKFTFELGVAADDIGFFALRD